MLLAFLLVLGCNWQLSLRGSLLETQALMSNLTHFMKNNVTATLIPP
jgi:hypothetical protein